MQAVDWQFIWNNQYGDPTATTSARLEWASTLHINPQAAHDLKIADGDYVYVTPTRRTGRTRLEANDPFYKVARLMLRVKYNPSYRTTWDDEARAVIATERTEGPRRGRRRAVSADTGYQSMFRYGSQQSITAAG